jgi:hypothetical protein
MEGDVLPRCDACGNTTSWRMLRSRSGTFRIPE